MQKFCKKCGQKLDEKTGLCPDCDKSMSRKEKRTAKKEYKKAVKKEKKAEKSANLSMGQKIKRTLLKGLILVLILSIVIMGVSGVLAFIGYIDIPIVNAVMDKIDISPPVKKNIPETDTTGLEYYKTSEENIVTDNGITYINNEILVALKSKQFKAEFETYLNSIGGKIVGYIEEISEYQVLLDKPHSYSEMEELIRTFEAFEWVLYVSPNYAARLDVEYIPNDKKWEKEWDNVPDGTNWGMEAIDAPGAWEYKGRLSTVNIGVIDNMFDVNHKDLNFEEQPLGQQATENAIREKEVKWNSHGTHTSGTIAATFDNNLGVSGASIKTKLYGVSMTGLGVSKYYTSQAFNMSFAYLLLQKKCSVINISMGYDHLTFEASRKETYATEQLKAISIQIEKFLKSLIDKNYQFVICNSAGNQNKEGGGYRYFKKDDDDNNTEYSYYSYTEYLDYLDGDKTNEEQFLRYKGRKKEIKERIVSGNVDAQYGFLGAITDKDVQNRIIIVGSVENLGSKRDGFFGILGKKVHKGYKIAASSQCGERVDIIAPGVDIYSTVKNGYDKMSGTSMASPHVAGVAGLLFSVNPNLNGDYVKKVICDSATGSYGKEEYGLLNAKNAIDAVLSQQTDVLSTENEKRLEQMPIRTTSDERDIVLVLDVSGSMSGEPMEETKKASSNFISTILKEDASIGIVAYDDSASMLSDFSVDEQSLTSIANNITDGGGTNIESGLAKAKEMLNGSNAKKKIIVLMSDGEPNDGKVGDELISYADSIKADGTYIYTLGFFESMGSGKSDAQVLMEKIASEGCHYEVANADDLKFFFGDIADQINGQKYIYVRIACPVDVKVTHDGETLRSDEDDTNERTSFGSLTFEENKNKSESGGDNRIKILRLKDGTDYDVQIEGNGSGKMNYTIGFMDETGEYSDMRKFSNLEISPKTQIDTVASNTSSTTLNVDSDGDGKYDLKYKAKANSAGEIVDYSYIRYIIYITGILIILLILYIQIKKWKRKSAEKAIKKKASQKRFCVHCGNTVSGDKKFCPKCGSKME